jgi:hypothetical protein
MVRFRGFCGGWREKSHSANNGTSQLPSASHRQVLYQSPGTARRTQIIAMSADPSTSHPLAATRISVYKVPLALDGPLSGLEAGWPAR